MSRHFIFNYNKYLLGSWSKIKVRGGIIKRHERHHKCIRKVILKANGLQNNVERKPVKNANITQKANSKKVKVAQFRLSTAFRYN